jgi:hypothetical protein
LPLSRPAPAAHKCSKHLYAIIDEQESVTLEHPK